MTHVTLEEIYENIVELKREMKEIKEYIREDFELADDVRKQLEESINRPDSEFISHEEVKRKTLNAGV